MELVYALYPIVPIKGVPCEFSSDFVTMIQDEHSRSLLNHSPEAANFAENFSDPFLWAEIKKG
jgi:hypothetical protein